jgi:hypothetical protein
MRLLPVAIPYVVKVLIDGLGKICELTAAIVETLSHGGRNRTAASENESKPVASGESGPSDSGNEISHAPANQEKC